jgi:predicted enzyme related to lactoylglutathione lyase
LRLVTVLDCLDAERLAAFWAPALEWKRLGADAQYVLIGSGDRTQHELILQQVDEPKTVKNRMHLDIRSDDMEGEVERLLALGATRLSETFDECGCRWTVLADPEGNEFCVLSGVAPRLKSSKTIKLES